MKSGRSFYEAVWDLVRTVPRGRVVTYGQIATWLGSPRAARAVGYAMFNVQDPDVPWHRVINHQGRISIGGAHHRPDLQKKLLRREGVKLGGGERVDLGRYRWDFATTEAEGRAPAKLKGRAPAKLKGRAPAKLKGRAPAKAKGRTTAKRRRRR